MNCSLMLLADFWEMTSVRIVVGVAVISILVVALVYVIKKYRGMALGQEDPSLLDHLSDFREMRDTGQIDEKDYRKLKSQLSKQALEETISQGDANETTKLPDGIVPPDAFKDATKPK